LFLENIKLTRIEYLELKRHLAKTRGYEVPESEPETAPAEAADAADGPISRRLLGGMFDRIMDDLKREQDLVANRTIPWTASDSSESQADLALLHDIVEDWTGDGRREEYPNETKLIGTIRAHLDL
jgi:hypothetical protein